MVSIDLNTCKEPSPAQGLWLEWLLVAWLLTVHLHTQPPTSHEGKSLYVQGNFHWWKRYKVTSGKKSTFKVISIGEKNTRSRQGKSLYIQSNFHGWRRCKERNEVEWTGTAKMRRQNSWRCTEHAKLCMFKVTSMSEEDTRKEMRQNELGQQNWEGQNSWQCTELAKLCTFRVTSMGEEDTRKEMRLNELGQQTFLLRRAEFMAVHRACKAMYNQSNFHGWRRYEERNEVEWTGTAKMRKAEFMAVHRAYKAMYIQSNFHGWRRYKEKN